MHSAIAQRYSKALMSAALDMNVREPVDRTISLLSNLFDDSPALTGYLERVSKYPEAAEQITENLVESLDAPDLFARFLLLITQRKRLGMLESIVRSYEEERKREAGILTVNIYSSRPLEEQEKKKIIERLEHHTGGKLETIWQVDKSILGGIVIKIGDDVINGSLKHRLNLLQRYLLQE
ncbi:ATP synthase F1 subunit delta [bacterium]|nr:ATP synthase F1 subunit delta [candidate division CSSED10-310 bacterium]